MTAILGAAALLVTAAKPAAAQIRASEHARIEQTIDGTTFTIDYSRPRVRGREEIFGREVKWNEVWTPGANRATTLKATKDFAIEGHPIPAGKYSVWMQVQPKGDWEFILDRDSMRYHTAHPKIDTTMIHFTVRTRQGAQTEVLTWAFPDVAHDGATLEMAWSTVRVPLRITVQPTLKRTIAPAAAEAYVGEFDIEWLWGSTPQPGKVSIRYNAADSTLRANTIMEGEPTEMVMAPRTDGVFVPIFVMEGQIAEAIDYLIFEFQKQNGRAVSFDVRDKSSDKLGARGRRRP